MTLSELATATNEQPIALGRYDVLGHMETGGMGTVYHAVDREHGTHVALKTLNHLHPKSLLRFKHEFRSAADLSHPNLVALYELGRDGDLWYFTMERIEGRDFIRQLRGLRSDDASGQQTARGGLLSAPTVEASPDESRSIQPVETRHASPPNSIDELRDALRQLARALQALHEAGLLHLDIKPSNVLVDESGRVVLLDFGLTRPVGFEDPEGTLTIAGTPSQMAPEQFTGRGIAEAADWYAVGLMLYRALTGVPAFEAEGVAPTPYAKSNFAPTSPAVLLPELPKDLSDLAVALLNPDPLRRPTGAEVLAVLDTEACLSDTLGRDYRRVELIGRESEQAVLAEALSAVLEGSSTVVELVGPSGVGKSALTDDLLANAEALDGPMVLRGRCYERETVPYKAFDAMVDTLAMRVKPHEDLVLDRWALELTQAFPVLGSVRAIASAAQGVLDTDSVVELRRRAVAALRELLTKLAARQPVVIAIDDLQWVDEDSALVLTKLLEEPLPPALLLVVGYRAEEAAGNVATQLYTAAVDRLRNDDRHRRVQVRALTSDDAQRLAAVRLTGLGVEGPGLASQIARESEGMPFFVEELAHFAAQGDASGEHVALEDVLAGRVEALDAAQRRLVETLAVANSPIPLRIAFAVAQMEDEGVLRALWGLQRQLFVRSTGPGADDRVELHHDRMREAVLRVTPEFRIDELHLALGRALSDDAESWIYDAVRHLNAASALVDSDELVRVARLNLRAGALARQSAAFGVALECFAAGAQLLEADAWQTEYDLMLGLCNGAADAAYLQSAWQRSATFVDRVKRNGRTVLDQLPAREAEIDALIAHNDFAGATDCGLEVLSLLGVELPSHPTLPQIEAAIGTTMQALAEVGPEGLSALKMLDDPERLAADRVLVRISSAAYFGRPTLFGVIASTLVTSAVRNGLTVATPYALSVFAIVLNQLRLYREAHTWANVALSLVTRFADRSLEARTAHCIFNLATNLINPLATTLENTRGVVEIGLATGDVEYAAYAAHVLVHNSFYAGVSLDSLWHDALETGEFLRGYDQVNALHVHVLFERVIASFTGRSDDPSKLDGADFSEEEFLGIAEVAGSRSAMFLGRLLMGLLRYHFSSPAEASAQLERARPYIDGAASTWHIPIFHQFAALAIYGLDAPTAEQLELAATDLAMLDELAEVGPANFAHRTELVRGAQAASEGRTSDARLHFDRAVSLAEEHNWMNDVGVAHTLAGRAEFAVAAYEAWGATALVSRQ